MHQLVAVTGLPASGKSTIGAQLATLLDATFHDKDAFLESLFEIEGIGGDEHRNRLSRNADAIFENVVSAQPRAVAASWWRHPRSSSASGTSPWWLQQTSTGVVELHCECSPVEAARRFLNRKRHAGHADSRWDEHDLVRLFEEQAALGPLSEVGAIRVSTEAPLSSTDIVTLVRSVVAHLHSPTEA